MATVTVKQVGKKRQITVESQGWTQTKETSQTYNFVTLHFTQYNDEERFYCTYHTDREKAEKAGHAKQTTTPKLWFEVVEII